MQNFAAGMLTDTRKFGQSSPVLNELVWFTIKHALKLRDVTMIYKWLTF